MEISQFLQTDSTLRLREKFLSVENERRKNILTLLHKVENSSFLNSKDNIENVHTIFHETHKLKGAGGTYGFSEMSLFYSELLKYVKPPSQEQRLYNIEEFKKIKNLLKSWSLFYKKYILVFNNLLLQKTIKKTKGVLFISQNRNDFFNNILSASVNNKKFLFSCYNYEDVLLALNYIDIEFSFIELNNKIKSVLDLMKNHSNTFKTFFFEETDNEFIKKEILLSYETFLKEKRIVFSENNYINNL